MGALPLVHLVFWRCGQCLDSIAELFMKRPGEIKVKAEARRYDTMRFKLPVGSNARERGREHYVEQAAEIANVRDSVDHSNGNLIGVGQGYCGRWPLGGLAVFGQGFSSIGTGHTADVARSPAVALDRRSGVATPRAA